MNAGTKVMSLAGLVLALGLACGDTAEVTPPADAPATDAPATDGAETPAPGGKAKLGKGKGKGKSKVGKRRAAECPEGVVAAPSWPGEYPAPIVEVTKPVKVKASAEPCGKATLDCELPAGLYHPWSDTDGDADYVTVRSIERWKALKEVQLDQVKVAKDEVVEVFQYLGEGFCAYLVGGQETSAECPDMMEGSFEAVPGEKISEKELFSFQCAGKTAWVVANEGLVGTPGVREGEVVEYGKVGPGK